MRIGPKILIELSQNLIKVSASIKDMIALVQ